MLKGCLGLLQYLLYCLCGIFIDLQPFGFYGSLEHGSGFLRFFFSLLPASLIISRTIHSHLSENVQICFLLTDFTLFPCAWILFNDCCHLCAIYDIATVQSIYCKSRLFSFVLLLQGYILILNATFYNNLITYFTVFF